MKEARSVKSSSLTDLVLSCTQSVDVSQLVVDRVPPIDQKPQLLKLIAVKSDSLIDDVHFILQHLIMGILHR